MFVNYPFAQIASELQLIMIERAQTIFTNATIIDGTGKRGFVGDVAVSDERVVALGDLSAHEADITVDCTNRVLTPGFIDTHLHIESSLITPYEFDRCVAPRGVTTAICDPHEIANVVGLDGIRYFQQASTHTLMDIRVQLSSCVPSTDMETAGAQIEAAELEEIMGHPSGIGLAEFMNYPGVIHRDPRAMAKLG